MLISMHPILGWVSFCMNYCINAAWHGGNQSVALLRCNEAQVALIAVFGSSVLLGLVSLIFLLTIPHRFSTGFRSGEFAGQSSTVTLWSLNLLLVLWQCGQVPSPAGKWNQHLHKACQQKEAWSAPTFPGRWLRWLWTSENTMDQHQQMTWQPKSSLTVETLHWTSINMDLWWLLMHLLQLQFTPCEAFPSVWIGFASQYSQACGHPCCLCTFSYAISSFQSTLHLICFDTALLEQSPLSVMTLCDLPSLWRVSMIVFWTIAKSAVFPIIVVS